MSFLTPIMSFLSPKTRSIQDITGFITITESTTDSLEITQQPVQQGAMISDHAFSKPTAFSAQIQFSPAGILSGLSGGLAGNLAPVYKKLLDLQKLLVPFTIVTPKRIYKNMLFATLSETTDKKTENVLAISAAFTQVVIVSVSTVVVPRSQLKKPGSNGGTQQAGKKSALLTGASGILPGVRGFTQ